MKHHKGSLSDLIANAGDSALNILKFYDPEEFELDSIEDRILISKSFDKIGRPEELLDTIKAYLGEEWETYLSPALQKSYYLDLSDLLLTDDVLIRRSYTERNEPLLLNLIDKKLGEYLISNGLKAIKPEVKIVDDSENVKCVTYTLRSYYTSNYLIKVILNKTNHNYIYDVYVVNSSETVTNLLTEKSCKRLKKLMYDMSEGDNLDISMMKGVLNLLEFEDLVLNSYINVLIKNLEEIKA